jgi:hypothetical protein
MSLPSKITAELTEGEKILWHSKPDLLWIFAGPLAAIICFFGYFYFIIELMPLNLDFEALISVGLPFIVFGGAIFIPVIKGLFTHYVITTKRILTFSIFSFRSYDIRPTTKFSYSKILFFDSLVFDQEVGQKFVAISASQEARKALDKIINAKP